MINKNGMAKLMRDTGRLVQRWINRVAANIMGGLSGTSRMYVLVVHGNDVYDALCTLEPNDIASVKREIRVREEQHGIVPIRRRKLREYPMELVVIEWPLYSQKTDTESLKTALRFVLNEAVREQRHLGGIALIVDWSLFEDHNFKPVFAKTFHALEVSGYQPIVIVQRCEHRPCDNEFVFPVEYYRDHFLTRYNLHCLLLKAIEYARR